MTNNSLIQVSERDDANVRLQSNHVINTIIVLQIYNTNPLNFT